MDEPAQRVRKRIPARVPGDTQGRRGCLLIGAALGIVAGVLIAFFVLPPVFGHFFGTADIELGKTYAGDGKVIRIVNAERQPGPDGQLYPGVFVVRLEVMTNKTWAPVGADFQLEMSGIDGRRYPASSNPALGGVLPLGNRIGLVLTFAGTERRDVLPLKLHLRSPEVRFHLQPGKPR